ncbi:MAG: HipA N-terminal domain-containing protein [Sphaerochaeta sp.]
MAYRRATVTVNRLVAGVIEEYEGGYRFTYDPLYLQTPNAQPVSLTLHLAQHTYESPILFSFFDGLIPEGWLLEIALNVWKLDRRDRFGVLISACKDCVGAVSVEVLP